MVFTAEGFARKLRDLRRSRDEPLEVLADTTGIDLQSLQALEAGSTVPSGDQVLILADHFSSEFTWLIDDAEPDPDANAAAAMRSEGGQLSAADRHSIAEFIHLCKSQALLEDLLGQKQKEARFTWAPAKLPGFRRERHNVQGINCAKAFRHWRDLPPNAIIPDIFQWLRDSGIRVFRRALQPNSPISGLFIRHPVAGRCILINYTEDIYRQRFSAAHEAGHALMDDGKPFNISRPSDQSVGFSAISTDTDDVWTEVRANAFASAFLMPPELLLKMGTPDQWRRPEKIVQAASELFVSIPALLSALFRDRLIDKDTRENLKSNRLRLPSRNDPELRGLNSNEMERKKALLEKGIHSAYVHQGFEAHHQGLISLGKLAEMLLIKPGEVRELAELFGTSLNNA